MDATSKIDSAFGAVPVALMETACPNTDEELPMNKARRDKEMTIGLNCFILNLTYLIGMGHMVRASRKKYVSESITKVAF